MKEMLPVLFIVGFAVVLAGALAVAYWLDQKRKQKLADAALQCGFQYDREGEALPESAKAALDLFNRGHAKESLNILRGAAAGSDVVIFDYRYTVGSGKSSQTYVQTVAAFKLRGSIPSFTLCKENLLHKMLSAVGYQDIDFDASPEFSKRYLLRGPDEQAIRRLFSPGLINFFETAGDEHLAVEGGGEWLLIYQLSHRSDPEKLREFVDQRAQYATGIISQLSARSATAF